MTSPVMLSEAKHPQWIPHYARNDIFALVMLNGAQAKRSIHAWIPHCVRNDTKGMFGMTVRPHPVSAMPKYPSPFFRESDIALPQGETSLTPLHSCLLLAILPTRTGKPCTAVQPNTQWSAHNSAQSPLSVHCCAAFTLRISNISQMAISSSP